jgi:hypothetical protein
MDPIGTIRTIIEICNTIKEISDAVDANQESVKKLAERVEKVVGPSVQDFQKNTPELSTIHMSALQRVERAVTDIKEFISLPRFNTSAGKMSSKLSIFIDSFLNAKEDTESIKTFHHELTQCLSDLGHTVIFSTHQIVQAQAMMMKERQKELDVLLDVVGERNLNPNELQEFLSQQQKKASIINELVSSNER